MKDRNNWVVWLPGRKGSLYEGAVIPITITIPLGYPKEPPKVAFPRDFKHIHVYEGGAICMPIVDQDYWKPTRTMHEIISRFDSFLHQKPNLLSPANEDMLTLFMDKLPDYEQAIREQASHYRTQGEEYLMRPAVHIHYRRA